MLDKIAEEDEADYEDNLHHHLLLLHAKYAKMTIVELKKQRMKSIKELKEIHELLNTYLHKNTHSIHNKQQNAQTTNPVEIIRQLKYIQKQRKNLEKSLDHFQFMLTQQYNQKLHEEISEGKKALRRLKMEVGLLRRQMDLPMQKQVNFCEQLQRELLKLEQQLEKTKIKNRSKYQRMKQIEEQNKQKQFKIRKIDEEKMKKKEMEIELAETTEKNKLQQKASRLKEQKKKLQVKISQIAKKGKYKLNKLKKDKIVLEDTGLEFQGQILEIDRKIDESNQQIKAKNAQLRRIRARKRNSNKKFSRNRCETQPDNFSQKKSRVETIDYHSINSSGRYRKIRSSSIFAPGNLNPKTYLIPTKAKSRPFPNIYEYLGKNKLLIEDECDLTDLVYQGIR